MHQAQSTSKTSLVAEAVTILKMGRGHLGVINLLRSKGYSPDAAKIASYEIFDEAKKRISKQQFPHVVIAWTLVAVGVITPIALFIFQARIVILSAAPILAGAFILHNLVTPRRLPEKY